MEKPDPRKEFTALESANAILKALETAKREWDNTSKKDVPQDLNWWLTNNLAGATYWASKLAAPRD